MKSNSPEWIRDIRKGDILRERSGTLRVVRGVKHTARHTYVQMAIRRCSWTTRCYTTLDQNDLKWRFSPTGKSVRLNKEIDRAIEAEFRKIPITLTCCDVEGIG